MNYTEHFIMNSFVLGQSTMYGILLSTITYFFPSFVGFMMMAGIGLAAIIYSQIFKELYGRKYFAGFISGFYVYLIGMVFMFAAAIFAGFFAAVIASFFK